MQITNIIQFSGGKDSTGVLCYALKNLPEFEIIFCETGWEAPETYAYLTYISDKVNKPIKELVSNKYAGGMLDLAEKKGRFPSTKARFCTEELKVIPFIDYVLTLSGTVRIYQGIRKDESINRSRMHDVDDYFKHYLQPFGVDKQGRNKYHTY